MSNDLPKLLPCPFCGSDAEHYPDGDMEGYHLMCSGNRDTEGRCHARTFGYATEAESIAAWNRRAALAAATPAPCRMTYTPEWKTGVGGLPYQASNFACNACGYVGKHDAHPGCQRKAAHSAIAARLLGALEEAEFVMDDCPMVSQQLAAAIKRARAAIAEAKAAGLGE